MNTDCTASLKCLCWWGTHVGMEGVFAEYSYLWSRGPIHIQPCSAIIAVFYLVMCHIPIMVWIALCNDTLNINNLWTHFYFKPWIIVLPTSWTPITVQVQSCISWLRPGIQLTRRCDSIIRNAHVFHSKCMSTISTNWNQTQRNSL